MMYLTIFVFRNGLQDGLSTFELWPSACSRNDCGQFHYLYSVVIIVSDLLPSFMDRILSSFSIFKLIFHPALFPDIANRPGTGQSGSSSKLSSDVPIASLRSTFSDCSLASCRSSSCLTSTSFLSLCSEFLSP